MAKNIAQRDTVTNTWTWLAGETGTGSNVYATSPTLVTPVLGVADATSINKVAITAPAASATLTIANAKTATFSNTLTFAGTDGSTVTCGTGGTVAYTANNLSVFAATTSAQLAGVISDGIGSGLLVFATSPTLTTPVLGVATATTINGLTINATAGALTIANGSTLATSGAFALTLTQTAATNVTLPISGTLYGTLAASITSAQLLSSMTDETGTGLLVFGTSPTIATPVITGAISLGTDIVGVAGVGHTFQSANTIGATASDNVIFTSGDTASADSGTTTVSTGSVSTLGNSGALILQSGQSNVSGNSGAASMITGTALLGNSGAASMESGNAGTGNSGNSEIKTGNATTGASGNILFSTGTASTIKGGLFQRAAFTSTYQPAITTAAAGTAVSITAAQLLTRIIEWAPTTGGTRAMTLPAGAALAAVLPTSFTVNDSIDFTVINLTTTAATDTITLTDAGGITIGSGSRIVDYAGSATVNSSSATFRIMNTGVGTFLWYRIS